MSLDEDVTRYLYNLQPLDYATARFTDWLKPYLEQQLVEQRRISSAHYRGKLDDINEALANLEKLQPLFDKLLKEQMDRMKKALEDKKEYSNMADMKWPALSDTTGEIIPHFPPQLIIGKLTTAEELYFTHDDDPCVSLEFKQVSGEYAYGAPTGMFNLTIPDAKRKPQLAYQ